MHILIQKEIEQALLMMKYSINHPWKFRSIHLAFSGCFLQLLISLIVELSNIYITLANSESQFDIIADFIIMLVIADFDNYFYAVRNQDKLTEMITDDRYAGLFTWETTTSQDAKAKIPANELKPEMILLKSESHLRPKYIQIKFGDRECYNKFYYMIYRLVNLVYTGFYYYFMPFAATFFVANLLLGTNEDMAK